MADIDPFTQVYTALWDLLESNADFCAMVPDTQSRLKHHGSIVYYDSDEINEAEGWKVAVFCRAITPGIALTSNGTMTDTVWTIEINTAYQGATPLFRLVWAIMQAMKGWQTYLKNALTYNGNPFVWNVTARTAETALGDPRLNKGIKGWVAVWQGDVRMHFPTDTF